MTTATAAELETTWAERVRANRDQVDLVREVPDRDFYAPVSSLFVADPRRTGEEALEALLRLARPDERWLDIGAGAGRYALPLALRVAEVIAVEPSASMRNALRAGKSEHGLENLTLVGAAWPDALAELGEPPVADVAFIAHVGYDIEAIGPFIAALEAAATRLCVAVLMERVPAAAANPLWPLVHGEERVPLPALPDLLELLEAMGRRPAVQRIPIEPRRFEGRASLEGFVRRQLWIDPAGPKEGRFQAALDELAVEDGGGWTIKGRDREPVGIVTWAPP
jgi:SAM-dependent methyltransferase